MDKLKHESFLFCDAKNCHMKPKILVILGTTREGRRGIKVANWAMDILSKRTDANFEFVDLRDWNLPFYDFPTSPSTERGLYHNKLQKKWSEKIDSADGFLMITPEYNHGYSAVLKNAIDYTWYEWNHKPITFISYGSAGGGLRAVEQLRQVAIELEMVPIRQQILISGIRSAFDDNGEIKDKSYDHRLDDTAKYLVLWTNNLKKIRKNLAY